MKALKQLVKNKKGISSLFIAIYVALLAFTILSTLFVGLSISQSSIASYSKIEQERTQENILIRGPRALNVTLSNGVVESLLINNTGGITVRIRSLYIGGAFMCDPSTYPGDSYISPQSSLSVNLSALNINIYDNTILTANWTVTTERGTKSSETGANLWLGSTETQDEANKFYFGPLLLLFNMFHWSNDGGNTWNNGWTIPKSPGDVIWQILAADIDERPIILNASSSFALIQNSKQSNKIETWDIGPSNLNPSRLEPGSYYFIHFSLNGPNSLVDISTPNPVTLNFITIIGSFIEQDGSLNGFAQTIPFEAVKISATPEIPTYTSLNVIPSPQTVGQPVAVSGQVTVDAGATNVPQNSIVMMQYCVVGSEDWQNILSPQIKTGSGGSFTGSFSPPHAGTYEYRAIFMGATKGSDVWAYSTSTSQIITVNKATSTTTIQALPPITIGQSITVTATVNPSYATGTVTFEISTDSGVTYTFFCTKSIASGSAVSDLYTPSPAGNNYRFRGTYNGDADVLSSPPSTPVTLAVNKATPTLTTPTLNPASPITIGDPVTATVTISGVPGITPSGTITFRVSTNGGTTWSILSTHSLTSGSVTSGTYTPSAGGNQYQIRADYSGDTNYNAVNSAVAPLTVRDYPSIAAPTFAPASPISFGAPVTIRVTVSGTYGTPTGNVDFQVSTDNFATFTKVGTTRQLVGGVATSDPYLAPSVGNNYQFRAVYAGDNNYLGITSPSSATLTVNQATSTTTIILTPSSAAVGQPVTATATVSPSAATGTVTFEVSENGIDYTPLGGPTPLVSGSATSIPYSPLTPGINYRFRAAYAGDTNVLGSTSLEVPLIVYGPLDHFVFQTIGTQTAGTAFSITITAKDANEITVLNYNGANSLSFSAGTISPTTTGNFVNGVRTISVTVTASGSNVFISTTGGGATGQSNSFTVNPGPLARFQFNTISSPQTAGTPFSVTITAQDAYGNTVTSYTGTNALTASTGTITPTTTASFSNGAWTGIVTLTRASIGTTISTTGGSPTRSGTSNAFDIIAGSLDRFIFSSIGNQIEGIPSSITITAQDAYGNIVTSYAGTNSLTDLSNTIIPTSTSAFTSGIWTGSVTITNRYPADAITTVGDGKTGTSNTFTVTGPLDHFTFNTIGNQVAGTQFSLTITAVDSDGSTIASYNGANTLSVSTGTIIPTSTGAFTNGVRTISVNLTKAGSGITISTLGATKTGTSEPFNVAPAAFDHFTITGYPSSVTAGDTINGITVTALDAYNNVKTDYSGQVYFTSNDNQSVLPYTSTSMYTFNGGDQGIHTFNGFSLRTAGTRTVTVTNSIQSATSGSITVNPTLPSRFAFSNISSPQSNNTGFQITITAKDQFGNTVTGYTGSTSVSATTGPGTMSPASVSFSNGQWTGTVTMYQAGTGVTLSASAVGANGTSNPFNVYGPRSFSAGISPVTFRTGANQPYTVTITNLYAGNNLGSARVTIPAGFSVSSATITPPAGRSWATPTIASGLISITANNGNNNPIRPGESITITFTPTQTPTSGTSFNWTTTAYTDRDYSGTQFYPPNPQPQTKIQYYLTVTTSRGTSTGQGWYDALIPAYAGLDSGIVGDGSGTQYVFTSWSVDASGTNYARSNAITMNSNKTATANWKTQYAITASAGPNGLIDPLGTVFVDVGSSQTFTITTDTGYHIGTLTVDGSAVPVDSSYSFTNVYASHTISATFAIDTNTIVASAGANGAINPSGNIITNYGGSQSFTITPSLHYHVADVLVDSSSVGAVTSYTFTDVIAPHTITASFAIDTYTITVTAGTNGAVSPGTQTVDYGATPSFSITPATGYHVLDVKVDGASFGPIPSYTFNAITADHTLEATFEIDTYSITASAGASGSISPSGNVPVDYGDSPTFTMTPNIGYHIFDVLVDDVSVGNMSSYTFASVSASHAIAVTFAIDTFTISVNSGTYGSIAPGTTTVNYGSSQTFDVAPEIGYHIFDVEVDGVSQGAIAAYTFSSVQANHAISATFEINTYTITATASAGGTISPSGSVTVNHGSDQTFAITPDIGYNIVDVTVDGTLVGAITSFTFTSVTADHTISATFST